MQDDLFGHTPQRGELFAEPMPIARQMEHTPETIRELMLQIISEAKSSEAVPWTSKQLRSYTARFPYMAEWLKDGEGEQLMLEFKVEIERLDPRVEELAPNWRKIWGLAA